jgi:hypothetical protein
MDAYRLGRTAICRTAELQGKFKSNPEQLLEKIPLIPQ